MSKEITFESLLELMIQETNNQFSDLDEAALIRIAARINFEYVHGFNPSFKHKKSDGNYEVAARGKLENSSNHVFVEGDELVAYRGNDGKEWFRLGQEFDDGRFKSIKD